MTDPTTYDVLADAFRAEGVDAIFGLMGDANMHWSISMKERGSALFHARHEHAAVSMADGYARATGHVGVATVTCGPGFTQIMTALTVAHRARTPLVVFAGDTPLTAAYHVQSMDQGPLTVATGATYLPVRSQDRLLDNVREAFYLARYERKAVVLSVPIDLQKQAFQWPTDYIPSSDLIPAPQRVRPAQNIVARAADMIRNAKRPIILAGKGAVAADVGADLETLADICGALLATTLPAKGLFDSHPFSIGIAGSFASKFAHELFAESDLVVGVGAGLGYYTTEAGYLYPNAHAIQIDTAPHGLWQGLRVADLHMQADAREGVSALIDALRQSAKGGVSGGWHSDALKQRINGDVPDDRDYPAEPGSLDPRKVVVEIDRVIPKDWDVVCGSGHCFNFVATHLRGRDAKRYHMVTDFGTIGQALTTAIGIAAARNNGKVVLFQGDGSLLLHIQELEMVSRHKIKLLICALNDGAYSSEVHMLKAKGQDAAEAIFGRPDLAAVSRAFGMNGISVSGLAEFQRLFSGHDANQTATLWDIPISGIPSAQYRRLHYGDV